MDAVGQSHYKRRKEGLRHASRRRPLSTHESNNKTPANTAVVSTASRKNSPKVYHFAKLPTYSAVSAPISGAMWARIPPAKSCNAPKAVCEARPLNAYSNATPAKTVIAVHYWGVIDERCELLPFKY